MVERFKKPTEQQLLDIALLFNEGVVDIEKLTCMYSMCDFVLDRLYENGDILKPSSKEIETDTVLDLGN